MRARPTPSIFTSKEGADIEGKLLFPPILFLSGTDTFDEGNDWLRHLLLKGRKPYTVGIYGYRVLSFLKFLTTLPGIDGDCLSWHDTSTSTLRMWRNGFELDEVKGSSAKQNVSTILQFLEWAYINDKFNTPVVDRLKKGEFGAIARDDINLSVAAVVHSPPPSTFDMMEVQQAIAAYGGAHVERDLLMFRWAKEVGFRSGDITDLRPGSLPNWGQIFELERQAKPAVVLVTGKNGKTRKTHPPISLLKDTRSYIESLPADEVKSIDRVFYSQHKLPFAQQYISHKFAHYFKIAGLDSHLHRARAYYLHQVILTKIQELSRNGDLNDFSAQSVLQFALNVAGHSDIETLKYYVDLALLSLDLKPIHYI